MMGGGALILTVRLTVTVLFTVVEPLPADFLNILDERRGERGGTVELRGRVHAAGQRRREGSDSSGKTQVVRLR